MVLTLLLLVGCVPAKQTTPTAPPQPPRPPEPKVQPLLPPPVVEGPRKVALLLPLSGNAAPIGQDMLDAAHLALFESDASDLLLLPRDTASDPQTAKRAAADALAAGAELVLGPLFAASTSAVAPLARERGALVLSFSNDAAVAGNGVFVLGFRPEEQIARILAHAREQGWRRLGLLAPADAYGTVAVAAWRRELGGRGDPAAEAIGVYPASGDPTAAVRAFLERHGGRGEGRPPELDAILLADGGLRLRQVAALLAFFDVDPARTRLLGTRLWADDPAVLRDPALEGGRFAAPDPTAEAAFRERFRAAFGREPVPLAALAFDGVRLVATLLAAGRPLAEEALLDPRGFPGVLGPFRLRPEGVAEHALAILQTSREGPVVVEPAPARFPPALARR